jgi:Family of unknown function (DUF6529)
MERAEFRPSAWVLAGIGLLGALVSVSIGIYANEHQATGRSILGDGLFFTATINMKAWLATAVAFFALIQLFTALRMFDRIHVPRKMPGWLPTLHRISGTVAFLIALPVAYHCVWALGFQFEDAPTRVAIHSLLGCFFFGAFSAKMLFLKVRSLPGLVLPIVGGLTFASVIGIWLTSSLWFFDNFGFPEF